MGERKAQLWAHTRSLCKLNQRPWEAMMGAHKQKQPWFLISSPWALELAPMQMPSLRLTTKNTPPLLCSGAFFTGGLRKQQVGSSQTSQCKLVLYLTNSTQFLLSGSRQWAQSSVWEMLLPRKNIYTTESGPHCAAALHLLCWESPALPDSPGASVAFVPHLRWARRQNLEPTTDWHHKGFTKCITLI